MQIRKAVVLLGLTIFVIGSLFAATLAAPKQVTLSVLYDYVTEAGRASVQKSLDLYQKKHPNIKLNIQVVTQAKWAEVVKTRAIANDLPDVAMAVPQRVGEWATAGKLEAGNKYIPKSVLNKYSKARLLSDTYNNGQIYGLPFADSVRAVAYNADYFAKAGIKPPAKAKNAWTWDQMVEAAKKAQAASGAKYALQFGKASMDSWLAFIYQAGGALMSDDFSKATLNTPQVRKALEWTVKLHKDGIAAPGIIDGTEDPLRLFASGATTLWMPTDNSLILSLSSQAKFKFGFTFMPKDVQQATVIGGSDWIAFKGSHPKESWDLILYMVSAGPMKDFNEALTAIPPRSDVHVKWSAHPEFASFFAEQARQIPEALIKQQLHPAYGACRDKLLQELSACVSGQKSVDDAVAAMNQYMNDSLKQNHY